MKNIFATLTSIVMSLVIGTSFAYQKPVIDYEIEGPVSSNVFSTYGIEDIDIQPVSYEYQHDLETTPVSESYIDPRDIEMLACIIYQEAGGDACCDMCRRRVADVVLNRVADERFPNTIEEVLTAKYQYGFYYTGIVWAERASYPGEAAAVARAYRIAEEVLRGKHSDLYGKGYIWQAEFVQGTDNVYCDNIIFGR